MMDLEARVTELEMQLRALQEIVRELQSDKSERDYHAERAARLAKMHPSTCACNACLQGRFGQWK
jgi:hypothetical protein